MKGKKRFTKWFIYFLILIIILGTLLLIFNEPIQKSIDNYSVKDLKENLLQNFNTGDADSLKSYLDTFNLDKYTTPTFVNKIRISNRTNWSLKKKTSENLIEEKISFPSHLAGLIPSDSAYFYVYRKDDFKNSKIIVWVPGLGVSDLAFCFIKQFFITEIENGYTVVVYIPPFHLNRKHPDKENGDGFIGSNIQNNLKVQLEAVRELRTILEYLEQQKPKEISAWGGSMGASFLLLTSKFHQFEHISLMIPMVNWEHTMLQNKELSSLLPYFAEKGIDSLLLARAFKTISPVNYKLNLPNKKTFIQFAEYDQLTSKKVIQKFAKRNGIDNIKSYQRGHATMLLNSQLHKDYEEFLTHLN